MRSGRSFAKRFTATVRSRLPKGRLLACVSGGADSVAMLHALLLSGADVIVAHCNFNLRGDESLRDKKFVTELCRKLGVELVTIDFDVEAYCAKRKVSVEMACRELRYDFFRRTVCDKECCRMAVAHNADDNVETMLLNMLRGTGLKGLAGMKIDTGEILRPLLTFSRKQVEQFLADIEADYVVDSTNLTSDYRRNFLRRELLPMLEKRWPGAVKALQHTRENLADALEVYESTLAARLPGDSLLLPLATVKTAASPAAVIHEFLRPFSPSATQVRDMAVCNRFGSRWELHKAEVVLTRDGFHVLTDSSPLSLDYEVVILEPDDRLFTQVRGNRSMNVVYLPGKWSEYRFRPWRHGDRIRSLGMKGSQLVSDVIKDARLSPRERAAVQVLEDTATGCIVWIPGLKRSSHRLLTGNESHVLKVTAHLA